MTTKREKVTIYIRGRGTSKKLKIINKEINILRQYCLDCGYDVVGEYVDFSDSKDKYYNMLQRERVSNIVIINLECLGNNTRKICASLNEIKTNYKKDVEVINKKKTLRFIISDLKYKIGVGIEMLTSKNYRYVYLAINKYVKLYGTYYYRKRLKNEKNNRIATN